MTSDMWGIGIDCGGELSKNRIKGVRILVTAIFLSFLSPVWASEVKCTRRLHTRILCPSNECTPAPVNLLHTEAVGQNDTIHYVYSTWGIPSVLVAKTSLEAKLHVDYSQFLNDTDLSVRFTEDPQSVFVVMVAQVVDYEKDDKGDKNTTVTEYDLGKSQWELAKYFNSSPDRHVIEFRTSNETEIPKVNAGGAVIITFRALCNEGYYSELPNLHYNSNMSLADVVLDNLRTSNVSRLSVQLFVAAPGAVGKNMTIEKDKSIDDEHSPGSFVTLNWLTNAKRNLSDSDAFLQWKPTCYTKPTRNLQSLSSSRYTGPTNYNFLASTVSLRGLAYYYWGPSVEREDEVNVAYSNISFGLPGDGYYVSTKYDAWSFSFGFGIPPTDKISLSIIVIIVVGLGIPVGLTVAGAVYICVRRLRRHRGYTEIAGNGSYAEIN